MVNTAWIVILPNSKTEDDSYHDLSPISRQIFIKSPFLSLSTFSQS